MKIYKIPKGTNIFYNWDDESIYYKTDMDWYFKQTDLHSLSVYKNNTGPNSFSTIKEHYLFTIKYKENIILYKII